MALRLATALYMALALHAVVVTAAKLKSFTSCWLLYEGPDDLGYSYTINQNRRTIDEKLQALYPSVTIQSYAATHVAEMTTDQQNATMMDFIQNKGCNAVMSSDGWLIADGDAGLSLAKRYPNVSFVVLDDSLSKAPSGLPNLVWGTALYSAPFWIAGVTAAAQAQTYGGAACFMAAYETGALTPPESANAFIMGVRRWNTTMPIKVINMNNWYWAGAEELVGYLFAQLGCKVIARFTDPRLLDIWVNSNPQYGIMTIGTHSDVGAYVGDSVLMSVMENFLNFESLFANAIETGVFGLTFPLYSPASESTTVSPVASDAAKSAFAWAVANQPSNDAVVCGVAKTHDNVPINYTQSNGCLGPTERLQAFIYDPHTAYYVFSNGLDCAAGTYYEYSFPDLTMTCRPCPANTYRPPEQTSAQTSCTPCPAGFSSGQGATICTQSHDATTVIVAVIIPVVVVTVIIFLIVGIVQRRRQAEAMVVNAPKEAPCCLIFTDVESSTDMWMANKNVMQQAIDLHHQIIRQEIEAQAAYEVKTAGDSFMIAVRNPVDAVLLCMSIQKALNSAPWPKALTYTSIGKHQDQEGSSVWRGLRVRIGLHYCTDVKPTYESARQYYDYYGNDVNCTARVESEAKGGQILVTEETLHRILSDPDYDALLSDEMVHNFWASNVRLKGIDRDFTLHSIVPISLASRDFGGEHAQQQKMDALMAASVSGPAPAIPDDDASSVASHSAHLRRKDCVKVLTHLLQLVKDPAQQKAMLDPIAAALRIDMRNRARGIQLVGAALQRSMEGATAI